jgi:hypothetical protein
VMAAQVEREGQQKAGHPPVLRVEEQALVLSDAVAISQTTNQISVTAIPPCAVFSPPLTVVCLLRLLLGRCGRRVEAHASGRDRSHTQLLLAVLMLEVWLTTYLPRALKPPVVALSTVRLPA